MNEMHTPRRAAPSIDRFLCHTRDDDDDDDDDDLYPPPLPSVRPSVRPSVD